VAWLIGGAVALFGALTLAELAAALPRSGGVFAYLLEGFGPLPAFLFGWSELTVIRASAFGAIATIFAEYLGYFVELSPEQVRWTAAAAILVTGCLNYLGVRSAARFMNLITALKYGSLAGLALLALTAPAGTVAHFTPAWSGGLNVSLLATALIAIMWTYDGWADLSFMGGEVRDPQRTLPLALILGSLGCICEYHHLLQQSVEQVRSLGVDATTSDLLERMDATEIPLGLPLAACYMGFFLCAEGAFVLMAIREYLQDLLGLEDRELVRGRARKL